MKQLLKEFLVLLTIVPISLVILFFVMQKAEQSRQIEKLSATIEKKELTLSSPVFGSLETFSVEEGDIVKKNQTIAKIQVIDKKDSSNFASPVYTYNQDTGIIEVKSPVDAVVVKKEFAEKSTIKPEENIVVLNPISDTVIKIQVTPQTNVNSYESIEVTDKDESYYYPLVFAKRLPLADKDGKVYYFATLTDQSEAKEFYNNEQVIVKARKPEKALTGKIEAAFADISKRVNIVMQNYL